jgi:hypothetical protein
MLLHRFKGQFHVIGDDSFDELFEIILVELDSLGQHADVLAEGVLHLGSVQLEQQNEEVVPAEGNAALNHLPHELGHELKRLKQLRLNSSLLHY